MFGERLWLITMRSDLIKKGPSRAPHRSLLRALGIDELEGLKNKETRKEKLANYEYYTEDGEDL